MSVHRFGAELALISLTSWYSLSELRPLSNAMAHETVTLLTNQSRSDEGRDTLFRVDLVEAHF